MSDEAAISVNVICANEMTFKAIVHCDNPLNEQTAKNYYFHFWKENGQIYVWLIPVGFTPEHWKMKLESMIKGDEQP